MQDVREALREDAAGKCYLCESKERNLQVEHLQPQQDFPGKSSEWTNLLLACGGSCNQRRIRWNSKKNVSKAAHSNTGTPLNWPVGGMLNPGRNADTEERLHQIAAHTDEDLLILVTFEAVSSKDLPAVNTAIELNHIHNTGRGDLIRSDITRRIRRFNRLYRDWTMASEGEEEEKIGYLLQFRQLTRPEAEFAGLMRSYVRRAFRRRPDLLKQLGLHSISSS